LSRQFLHRCFRKHKQILVIGALKLLPPQRVHVPGFDSVGLAHVPVIVKTPDHHSMLLDKRPLLRPDRIVLRNPFRRIQMRIERRLVGDHEIQPFGRGSLQNVHRRHHGHGDASDWGVRISSFERVNSVLLPLDTNLLLNFRDQFARRDSLFLSFHSGDD